MLLHTSALWLQAPTAAMASAPAAAAPRLLPCSRVMRPCHALPLLLPLLQTLWQKWA
jgi:hypothetical protein